MVAVTWHVLLSERGGYGILKGPTFPCCYYAGMWSQSRTTDEVWPLWNDPRYYHRTEDEALDALIKMRERQR